MTGFGFVQVLVLPAFTPCWEPLWMAGSSSPQKWMTSALIMQRRMLSKTTWQSSLKVGCVCACVCDAERELDNFKCNLTHWTTYMCVCVAVVKVPQKTLLMDALKDESIVYDFCMCNPPFFANQLEAKVHSAPVFEHTLHTRDRKPPGCFLAVSVSLCTWQ